MICTRCLEDLPATTDYFMRRPNGRNGLNRICKNCCKERRSGQPKLALFDSIMRSYRRCHPCVNCGETDIRCLDFHHKDPKTKSFPLSHAYNKKITEEQLRAEIDKCEMLCANCHRKLHLT